MVRDYDTDELMGDDDDNTEGEDEDDGDVRNEKAETVIHKPNTRTELEHQPKSFEEAPVAGNSAGQSQAGQVPYEAVLERTSESPRSVSPEPKGLQIWTRSEAESRPPSK